MSGRPDFANVNEVSEGNENLFCIYLHIMEGKGLQPKDTPEKTYDLSRCRIILQTSLNGLNFEVRGKIVPGKATVFNNRCIWEAPLNGIKTLKSDQRPIKIECFLKYGLACTPGREGEGDNITHMLIGNVLLPLRGVPIVMSLQSYQPNKVWHKLGTLSPEYRTNKPELHLLLATVSKSLVKSGQFEELLFRQQSPSISFNKLTGNAVNMLQSQSNVHVKLLKDGVIQVGNIAEIDCDIFELVLNIRQLRNLEKFLLTQSHHNKEVEVKDPTAAVGQGFAFQYEILGNPTRIEIFKPSVDNLFLNEAVKLIFRTSLKSLRGYFERIFFIPISLYADGRVVANGRIDCSKFMPNDDSYFAGNYIWKRACTVFFDRLQKMLSPRAKKPALEFQLSIQQKTFTAKKIQNEIIPLRQSFVPLDKQAAGDAEIPTKLQRINVKHVDIGINVFLGSKGHELVDVGVNTDSTECNQGPMTESKDEAACDTSSTTESNRVEAANDDCVDSKKADETAAESKTENTSASEVDVEARMSNEKIAFEEWKAARMEEFLVQLDRKETKYLLKISESWESKYAGLRSLLATKFKEFDSVHTKLMSLQVELKTSLDKAQQQVKMANEAKDIIAKEYAEQRQILETEITRLKNEVEAKQLELQAKLKAGLQKKSNLNKEQHPSHLEKGKNRK